MNLNKTKILQYTMGFIIIVLLIFGSTQYFGKRNTERLLSEYKETLIKSDSLKKVSDGHYQKLVSDINSKRDLTKLLKEQNEELYRILKEEKKKPISYTVVQAQPKSKIDTIIIRDTIRNGQSFKTFSTYYPNKEEYFVKLRGLLHKDTIESVWDFNKLDIGVVVSEKQKGIFEADLDAPEWLNVTDIQVNTLPLENIRPDNFDWMLGGAAGLDFLNQRPVLEIEGGLRYKKSIFSIQGNTNQEVLVGFKKLF